MSSYEQIKVCVPEKNRDRRAASWGAQNMKFHHIGLAVKSIERELSVYRRLGSNDISPVYSDPLLKVRVCFVELFGLRLELVEPLGSPSPIDVFLQKKIRMYHQCFEVSSLESTIERMQQMGALSIVPPTPAVAFEGRRVCFYILPNQDIVEFLEAQLITESDDS